MFDHSRRGNGSWGEAFRSGEETLLFFLSLGERNNLVNESRGKIETDDRGDNGDNHKEIGDEFIFKHDIVLFVHCCFF
jgi:hypothetical protein